MALFSDDKIVPWDDYDEYIPLTCRKCGATFWTVNLHYPGAREIYYGDDFAACRRCEELGHRLNDLKPDWDLFERHLEEANER